MRSNLQEQAEVPRATRAGNALPLSRRAFRYHWGECVRRTCSVVTAQALPICRRQKREYKYRVYVTIVEFSPKGKKTGKVTVPRIVKADAESQQQLSPISYEVTREAGTEQPYTGSTWNLHDRGLFHCICCDTGVFSSNAKFDSGTGWRSFGNQSRVKILSKLRIGGWG
jgi:SelR domain